MNNTNLNAQIEEVLSSLGFGDSQGTAYLNEAVSIEIDEAE